jgi:OOP family OmpA-OmpF porin
MLIKFDQNKADIDPYYFPDLAKVAHFLNENLAVTVTVEGYVTTATPSASIEIARSRLQNVVNYLVDNFGVSRSRFVLEDSSHSRLFVANVGDRGMPDHCRVKIILNYPPLVPFDRTSNA